MVLRAESEHTANLLREHLGTLGSMLQNGSQQEVRIEVAHPQESGRSWQQTDQNGGGQNGQPQEQHRDPKRESRKLPSSAEAGAAGAGDRTCVRK